MLRRPLLRLIDWIRSLLRPRSWWPALAREVPVHVAVDLGERPARSVLVVWDCTGPVPRVERVEEVVDGRP